MILSQLVSLAVQRLEQAGVVDPGLEIEVLLGECLGKSRTQLYLSSSDQVRNEDIIRFENYLRRREQREPTAYILGYREFWSKKFHVSPAVLIPRPETEYLLEKVLEKTDFSRSQKILDMCCGSGVIGSVLAMETGQRVICADLSSQALEITKKNVVEHKLAHLVSTVQTDLFNNLDRAAKFSLIVTNPPYVSRIDVENSLEPEVKNYEPVLALDGGNEGLEIIQRIAVDAIDYLDCGGDLFMEIGADQGQKIIEIFGNYSQYYPAALYQDYAGRDRVIHVTRH